MQRAGAGPLSSSRAWSASAATLNELAVRIEARVMRVRELMQRVRDAANDAMTAQNPEALCLAQVHAETLAEQVEELGSEIRVFQDGGGSITQLVEQMHDRGITLSPGDAVYSIAVARLIARRVVEVSAVGDGTMGGGA